MELNELVNHAAQIKAQIDELTKELKACNQQIYEQTVFPADKKTATIQAGTITAKVSKKETFSWDQAKLEKARIELGEEEFYKLFGYEWKARSKKSIDGFLAYADDQKKSPIIDALTIKESYGITYEEVKEVKDV